MYSSTVMVHLYVNVCSLFISYCIQCIPAHRRRNQGGSGGWTPPKVLVYCLCYCVLSHGWCPPIETNLPTLLSSYNILCHMAPKYLPSIILLIAQIHPMAPCTMSCMWQKSAKAFRQHNAMAKYSKSFCTI